MAKNTTRPTSGKKRPVNKKKKKKSKFNVFKFIRALIIIAIVIFLLHAAFKFIFAKTTPAPPSPAQIAAQQQAAAQQASKVEATVNSYKSKQLNLLHSLFRFNQNLYLCMSNTTASNIYPDSQNAVKALQNNFNTFSSSLNATDAATQSAFLTKLSSLNTAYVQSIITYNTEALKRTPDDKELGVLFKTLQSSYNNVNKFINNNIKLFQ